jgi:ActD protein
MSTGHGVSSADGVRGVYGLLAEFDREDRLVAAARRIREAGYRRLDAYSPFPVHGLAVAIGRGRSKLPLIVFTGGAFGAFAGFFLQWYSAVVHYPINVGGRPYNSWPAFIPIMFETTVLCASLSAVFGMLALNGLPQPYHPVFHIKAFERASSSGFFLLVESRDAKFDLGQTRRDLSETQPVAIYEVPP